MLSLPAVDGGDARSGNDDLTPGERLCRARVRKGWTQKELADRAGRSVGTIRNLEDGKRGSRTTVAAVAEALGETPESLGFEVRTPLRSRKLTPDQRAVIDDYLSLSDEDQASVRAVLAALRKRSKGGPR